MEVNNVFLEFVQYGFAGFCFILVAGWFWTNKQLLIIIKENTKVISENNHTLIRILDTLKELQDYIYQCKR